MAYGNPNLLPVNGSTFEGGSHAFTAGSNTTLVINSGGALEGTYSVRATPTAAGSVAATSPRFNVTSGVEYVATAPFRNSAATAGKTATATVTWYDATSGGSSLGTTVGTASVSSTAIGWWTVNWPVAIGVAPSGALSATITLTVSGLPAAEYINIDRVYAGITVKRTGNLLSFGVSSVEQDTSGWVVDNGTLARLGGTLEDNGTGYYCLGVTSTVSGDMPIRVSSLTGATPGQTYVSYLLMQIASGSITCYYELRWYDASATQIGVEQRTLAADTTIRRVAISGTAPAGTASVKVWVRPQATAAGQVFAIDDVWLTVAPNDPSNLLTYEEFSTESTLPSWTLAGGTGLDRVYLTSNITNGYFVLSYVPTSGGIQSLTLDRLVPVTPGRTYAVGATYFGRNPSSTESTAFGYRVRIDWYDASGVLFQADNPDGFYTKTVSASTINGSSSTETRTCPEGASSAKLTIELDHSNSIIDQFYIDNAILKESTPEYTLVTDDDTGSVTYTVHSQPSYGLGGTISVFRVHQDGTMLPLRGYGVEYDKAPFTQSPLVIEDYEAPLGERVWYSTQWYDTSGNSSFREYTQSVATPVLDDPDYVWFKSPGLPATNTRVMMESPPTWSRASRSAVYDLVGRKNPVHVSSRRGGHTASITLLVWDEPSHALFDALLDSGLPSLIQSMPGYGANGNWYISVGDVDVESVTGAANEPGWRWTLQITEIDRPAGGLQGSASLTWQSITDTYTAWEDVFDADETWSQVLTEG